MKLSKTEAHILSTLEQAKGEVVSRHAFGLTSESNTLEVLISRIRKKMDVSRNNGGTVKSIQTIRAVGYRLVTP